MTDQPLPLKPFNERFCEHCGGLIKIRMPVPSSGCDHLYYPDYCDVCKAVNPTEMDKLKAKIQEQASQIEILIKALETLANGEVSIRLHQFVARQALDRVRRKV